ARQQQNDHRGGKRQPRSGRYPQLGPAARNWGLSPQAGRLVQHAPAELLAEGGIRLRQVGCAAEQAWKILIRTIVAHFWSVSASAKARRARCTSDSVAERDRPRRSAISARLQPRTYLSSSARRCSGDSSASAAPTRAVVSSDCTTSSDRSVAS